MKLSAKKRGEIYDTINEHLTRERLYLRETVFKQYPYLATTHIDVRLAQMEAPLAQALIKLFDKDYK